MSLVSSLILAGAIIFIIAIILIVIAKQYRKVGPNEVLIIAGGRKKTIIGPDGSKVKVGYRYRLGGGTFVIPFVETVYRLPMEVRLRLESMLERVVRNLFPT